MSATSLLVPMRFIFLISNVLLIVEIIQEINRHAVASLDLADKTDDQKIADLEKEGTILLSIMLGFIAVEVGGLMSGLTFLSGFQQSFSSGFQLFGVIMLSIYLFVTPALSISTLYYFLFILFLPPFITELGLWFYTFRYKQL